MPGATHLLSALLEVPGGHGLSQDLSSLETSAKSPGGCAGFCTTNPADTFSTSAGTPCQAQIAGMASAVCDSAPNRSHALVRLTRCQLSVR